MSKHELLTAFSTYAGVVESKHRPEKFPQTKVRECRRMLHAKDFGEKARKSQLDISAKKTIADAS